LSTRTTALIAPSPGARPVRLSSVSSAVVASTSRLLCGILLWLRLHPCQRLGMPLGSSFTHLLVPRATVLPRPLQHLPAPFQSGELTRQIVPWTVVLPRPLQHVKVPILSGSRACPRVPRAPMLPRPLQQLQVPVPSGPDTDPRIPRAVVLPRPLQHLRTSAPSGEQ